MSLVYAENETELSEPIWLGVVCDENQSKQRGELFYMCSLRWKQ